MGDKEKSRQVLHKQARHIVFRVYQFFKRESEQGTDIARGAFPSVAKCQERTAQACDVGLRTVQRIASEANISIKASGSATFTSPGK